MADVVLGIDFGTCLSSVVVRRSDGSVLRVKDPVSLSFSVPSSVAVDKSGALMFGTAAERVKLTRPFVDQFKRKLGDETPLALGELGLTPVELVSRFVGWLRDQAEQAAGEAADRVVITVPASYEEHRRELMLDAAVATGFDRDEIAVVQEPVAATAFALSDRPAKLGEQLLVYDLGGGTFDVAVVQVTSDGFAVLSHDGAADVGGVAFDRSIADDVIARTDGLAEIISTAASDDRAQVLVQRRRLELAEFCRELKHQLSSATEQEDWVPGTDEMYELSRDRFEAMIAPLLAETLARCDAAVEGAGLSWPQLDRVVMVGGSTRIPAVAALLEDARGQRVQTLSEPELAVAEGAALRFGTPIEPEVEPERNADAELRRDAGSDGVVERSAGTASLRIERSRNLWVGSSGRFKVVLDGTVVGRLGNGERLELSIPAGEHKVTVTWVMTHSSEISFAIGPGARAAFVCHSRSGGIQLEQVG